jgi:hypothetical protein
MDPQAVAVATSKAIADINGLLRSGDRQQMSPATVKFLELCIRQLKGILTGAQEWLAQQRM